MILTDFKSIDKDKTMFRCLFSDDDKILKMEINVLKYDYETKKWIDDNRHRTNVAGAVCEMFKVDSVHDVKSKIGQEFDFEYDHNTNNVFLIPAYVNSLPIELIGEILKLKIIKCEIDTQGIKIYFQYRNKVFVKNYSFYGIDSVEEGFKKKIYNFLNDLEIKLNGFIVTLDNFKDVAKLLIGKKMYIEVRQYGSTPYLDVKGGTYAL